MGGITILNQSLIDVEHQINVYTVFCILCLEVIIIIVGRKSILAEDGAGSLLINVVHTLALHSPKNHLLFLPLTGGHCKLAPCFSPVLEVRVQGSKNLPQILVQH